MKKNLQLLTALMLLIALFGCDAGGEDAAASLESTWFVKGSFDNWADSADAGTRHFLKKDEVDNKILTYEITDLLMLDYQFVIVDTSGDSDVEWKAPTLTPKASTTPLIFVDADYTNAIISATKTSYTLTVDVTDPTKPSVTIVPGSTDSHIPTFTDLAAKLQLKGNMFSTGWNVLVEGTADVDAKTVTFDDLTVGAYLGGFGFNSLNGYLKNANITSPTEVDIPSDSVVLASDGSDCKIMATPCADSVFTVVITIDTDLTVATGRYSVVATLKELGSEAWVFDPWTEAFVPGAMNNWGKIDDGDDWSNVDAATATVKSGIATYEFTANEGFMGYKGFKVAYAAEWSAAVGFGGIIVDTTGLTLTDLDGNIGLADAELDTVYIVTIDTTTDTYKSGNTPTVKVVAK